MYYTSLVMRFDAFDNYNNVKYYCNDTFQVLMVRHIQLLLSVVQMVLKLVDLLTHLTIPY